MVTCLTELFSVLAASDLLLYELVFRWAARVLVNSVEACRHGRKVTLTTGTPLCHVSCPAVSLSLN